MKKLKQVKLLAHDHMATKWQLVANIAQISNPGCVTTESSLSSAIFHASRLMCWE